MFTKVHHVTYVVESLQQMADYLERNFGLSPDRPLRGLGTLDHGREPFHS